MATLDHNESIGFGVIFDSDAKIPNQADLDIVAMGCYERPGTASRNWVGAYQCDEPIIFGSL